MALMYSDSRSLGNVAHINYDMFTHELESVNCHFNCDIETGAPRKVTGSHVPFSHVHCKSGNIWKWCKMETWLLQTTNRK